MSRPLLVVLLVLGVVVAGVGTALLFSPVASAGFGWTAYAPLSQTTYRPDFTWWAWRPRIGALLLALGAGASGAALAALLMRNWSRVAA